MPDVLRISRLLWVVTLLLRLLSFDLGYKAVEAFVSVQPNLQRSYRKAAESEVSTAYQIDDKSKSPYLLFPGGG